jgi:hypothetical protein
MDQIEEKGLLLKQYLREMESALKEKQARQSQLHQSCRQIQRDLRRQNLKRAKLEKDLELAVRKDRDDIARMLIRKRRMLQAGCDGIIRCNALKRRGCIWPGTRIGIYAVALSVLCRVQSGICFSGTPIRALVAELVTVVGGIALVGTIGSSSRAAWPLGIRLFILIFSCR